MLDKLNDAINNLLGRFQPKPEYEEVGENLIKEDFSTRGILTQDNLHEHIRIPASDIEVIAHDVDKAEAHEKFLQQKFEKEIPQPIVQEEVRVPEVAQPEIKPQVLPQHSPAGGILRGVAFTLAALALLIFAYVVYVYTEKILLNSVPVTSQQFVFDNALVRADNTRTLSVESGVSREVIKNNILQTMFNEDVKIDKLTIIVPSYLREQVQDGKKVYVSETLRADDFLFAFMPSAPLALRTVAAGEYALGLANATGKAEGFLAFSVNDKVAATRELLRYETFMYQDLKDTLKLRELSGEASWKDLTVSNHDMRVLSDSEGVVLVYGFATNRVVVITPNVDIFEKTFQRLK